MSYSQQLGPGMSMGYPTTGYPGHWGGMPYHHGGYYGGYHHHYGYPYHHHHYGHPYYHHHHHGMYGYPY